MKQLTRRTLSAAAAVVGLISIKSGAAEPPPIPTGRPSELNKLEEWVGTWEITAKVRSKPDEPFLEGKGTEVVRWSFHRQFLISEQWKLIPNDAKTGVHTGWLPKLVITSWDPEKKQYRMTNVLPNGSYTTFLAYDSVTHDGTTETSDRGHVTRTWFRSERLAPNKIRVVVECSVDGEPKWITSDTVSAKVAE